MENEEIADVLKSVIDIIESGDTQRLFELEDSIRECFELLGGFYTKGYFVQETSNEA